MTDIMNWLQKPAMEWSPQVPPYRSDDATACAYWDPDLIRLIQSLYLNSNMNGETEREGSISYGALIVAAVAMVHSLRQRLGDIAIPPSAKQEVGDIAIPPSAKQEVGVCIVVAIPEGFLLPLAILVVHLLNEPTKVDSEASTMFAVLVPLEPGEGKERLRHMLLGQRLSISESYSGTSLPRAASKTNPSP